MLLYAGRPNWDLLAAVNPVKFEEPLVHWRSRSTSRDTRGYHRPIDGFVAWRLADCDPLHQSCQLTVKVASSRGEHQGERCHRPTGTEVRPVSRVGYHEPSMRTRIESPTKRATTTAQKAITAINPGPQEKGDPHLSVNFTCAGFIGSYLMRTVSPTW